MIKFILPAIIIFLIILFWEKITKKVYDRFKFKLNYVLVLISLLILVIILTLLYF